MKRTVVIGFLALFMVLLPAGCSSYKPVNTGDPVRVALAPIINEAEIPQIIGPLSRNLHEKLVHSPAWKLVDDAQAEAVILVTLTHLEREAVARDPSDTGRPLSYYETLHVKLEWISEEPAPWAGGPVTRIEVNTLLYAQPSLVSAETSAVAGLAEELARKIVARLGWPR